jgi:4a-hydroxytetrahydrobiopterin dehydratase
MSDLANRHCKNGADKLPAEQVRRHLEGLGDWELSKDGNSIHSTFQFDNYYQTISFVNAIAWMANREDHHPDLEVSYNRCVVHYSTHDAGGLTDNDFICAAKVIALLS